MVGIQELIGMHHEQDISGNRPALNICPLIANVPFGNGTGMGFLEMAAIAGKGKACCNLNRENNHPA